MGDESAPTPSTPPKLEDHRDVLLRYAQSLAPPGIDPEDLFHDTVVLAEKKQLSFDYPGQLINWFRRAIRFRALESAQLRQPPVDGRPPSGDETPAPETTSIDQDTADILEQARLIFEADPETDIRLASAWLLHLHEGRTVNELATHFVLTLSAVHRHVSASTLARRFHSLKTTLELYLTKRLPGSTQSGDESKAIYALSEALIYVAERGLQPGLEEARRLHHRLVNQIRTLRSLSPESDVRLIACECYLNDMMRDLDDDGSLRQRNLDHLQALRETVGSSSDRRQFVWAWFNFLISEKTAGRDSSSDWSQLGDYQRHNNVDVNHDMIMNIVYYSQGLQDGLAYAHSNILSRKGPHAPSLLLRVAQWHVLNREPRKAHTILKSIPEAGLSPDYVQKRCIAIEFCRFAHNDSDYPDSVIPSWILA